MNAMRLLARLDEHLLGRSRRTLLLLAAASLVLVFFLDVVMTADVHLTVFYLLPISIASWHVGARWGVVAALLSTATYQLADSFTRTGGFSFTLSIWNTAVIFGIFAANAISVSKLRANLTERRRLSSELEKARSAACEHCGKEPSHGRR